MRCGGYEYFLALLCKLCSNLGDNLRFTCSGRALQQEDTFTCQSSSYRKLLRIVKTFKTPFGFFKNRTACSCECCRRKQIGGKIRILYITAKERTKCIFLTLNLCLFCSIVIRKITYIRAFEFLLYILDTIVQIFGTEVYFITADSFIFALLCNFRICFLAKNLLRVLLFSLNSRSILNFKLLFLFCLYFFYICLLYTSPSPRD